MRGAWVGGRWAFAAAAIAAAGGCSPLPGVDESIRADERELHRAALGPKVRPEDCGGKVVDRAIVDGRWGVIRFKDGTALTVRGTKYSLRINETP